MDLLLLDECMSPRIVVPLWERGLNVVHVRDRALLGEPDHVIWQFAQSEQRAVVTINAGDFKKLAAKTAAHAGVIITQAAGLRPNRLTGSPRR